MKQWLIFCLVLVCVFLCACGEQQVKKEWEENASSTASTAASSSQTVKDKGEVSSAAAVREQTENTLKEYEQLYATTHRFTDCFASQKVWLLGKENLVQVLVLGEVSDVKVLPVGNIERVEHTALGDFTAVTVYDKTKTGQTLTLSVEKEKATQLLGILQ